MFHGSSKLCSRIDYRVDGNPHVVTITGGDEEEAWLGQNDVGSIAVQRCDVCHDRNAAASAPATGSNEDPRCAIIHDETRSRQLMESNQQLWMDLVKRCIN